MTSLKPRHAPSGSGRGIPSLILSFSSGPASHPWPLPGGSGSDDPSTPFLRPRRDDLRASNPTRFPVEGRIRPGSRWEGGGVAPVQYHVWRGSIPILVPLSSQWKIPDRPLLVSPFPARGGRTADLVSPPPRVALDVPPLPSSAPATALPITASPPPPRPPFLPVPSDYSPCLIVAPCEVFCRF